MMYDAIHSYLHELPQNYEEVDKWPCWQTNDNHEMSVGPQGK
jgi:hypothetical protein